MTRSALRLAALADAALPGLHPARVEEVADRVGEHFRVGFVEDTRGRRWVVRVPGDAVAAAQQDQSVALLRLLGGRLPFSVPQPTGFAALRDGRRALLYPLIPGRVISFATLPAGPGLAVDLGRAVAAVHNTDPSIVDEAGLPIYDADDCRRRHQADVDRGAATGLVPTGLLTRWERLLDDVSWWRFATAPVHGRLESEHVLALFDDEGDAASGCVAAVTSWENAQVGDPAEDLAALLRDAPPAAAETFFEAYAHARRERPDPRLRDRAGLIAELRLLGALLAAGRTGDRTALTRATQALRDLDDAVSDTGAGGNRSGTAVDRLPVDYSPRPASGPWYRAGAPQPDEATTEVIDPEVLYHAGARPAPPRPPGPAAGDQPDPGAASGPRTP